MDAHAGKIAELKRKLGTETDLGKVSRYFFDHLADDKTFIKASHAVENAVLRAMVLALAKQVVPQLKESECMVALTRYGETPFFHGSLFAGGSMGSVVYFQDLGKGCIGMTGPGGGQMHYLRFSTGAPLMSGNAELN